MSNYADISNTSGLGAGDVLREIVHEDLNVDANEILGPLDEKALAQALASLENYADDSAEDLFKRFRAYMILFGVFHRDAPEEGGKVYIKTAADSDNARAQSYYRKAQEVYAEGIDAKLRDALWAKGRSYAADPGNSGLAIPDELRSARIVAKTGLRIELDSCVGNDHVLVSQEIGADIVHVSILLRDEETGEYDFPIKVEVRRLEEPILRLSSVDKGIPPTDVKTLPEVFDLSRTGSNEWIRLSKAGVIASGIVPYALRKEPAGTTLDELLMNLGGGLEIFTSVTGVPVGSGTGTSSAIAAAIVAALVKFTGQTSTTNESVTDDEKMLVVARVLLVEQLIGALGGWQDPCVIFPGVKLLHTEPGDFLPTWRPIEIPEAAEEDLRRRLKLTDGAYRQPSEAAAWQFAGLWAMRLRDVCEARVRSKEIVKKQIENLEWGRIEAMGPLEWEDWANRRIISPKATNPYIEMVVNLIRETLGEENIYYDACGARGGAGGCFWINTAEISESGFERAFMEASSEAIEMHKNRIKFEGRPRIYDYAINNRGLEIEIEN